MVTEPMPDLDSVLQLDADERRAGRRHAIVLLIGKVRHGTVDTACLVHDISSRGLMARFTAAPQIGDLLMIEVRGLPEVGAVVRWVDGYKAGVQFEEVQDIERVFCLRNDEGLTARTPRFALQASATVRFGDRRFAVDMLDISPGGAKLRSDTALQTGQAGCIQLPDIHEPTYGAVCWTREDRFGFRFASPLPLTSLSKVLAGR